MSDTAPATTPHNAVQPGGFAADPDVMDTWATSSLTPQIQSHWSQDAERHQKVFPFDIRPQSHEIIQTWAFTPSSKPGCTRMKSLEARHHQWLGSRPRPQEDE